MAVFGILALYRFGYRAVEWVIMGLVAIDRAGVRVRGLAGPAGLAGGRRGRVRAAS